MKIKSILLALVVLMSAVAIMPASVSAEATVNIIITDSDLDISPGGFANYTITVVNVGDEGANITMGISGVPDGWIASFSDNIFYLDSGDATQVNLTVTIPEDEEEGTVEEMTIYASADRGTDESATVSTTVRAPIIVEWGAMYGVTNPLIMNTDDIATIPITLTASAEKVGTVVTLSPNTGSGWDLYFQNSWFCWLASDPVGSELDFGSRIIDYTIPSEISEIFLAISPKVGASPDDEAMIGCSWRDEPMPAPSYQIIYGATGEREHRIIIGLQNYNIEFIDIDTAPKEVSPGGEADYSFRIKNIGDVTCDILFEITIFPYYQDTPNWGKQWTAEIGKYSTPGDPGTWTPMSPGHWADTNEVNASGWGSYIMVMPTADTGVLVLRVISPTDATTEDNATTLITATVAQSSKPRATAEWFAGNELNESRNSTSIIPSIRQFFETWFIYIVAGIMAVVITVIIIAYLAMRRFKEQYCKNARTEADKRYCEQKKEKKEKKE